MTFAKIFFSPAGFESIESGAATLRRRGATGDDPGRPAGESTPAFEVATSSAFRIEFLIVVSQ